MKNHSRQYRYSTKQLRNRRDRRLSQMRHRKLILENLEERVLLAADFGDAPLPYPVTLAEDGARHEATGPQLGASRDSDADGTHSDNADADGADEDGVTFGTIMVGALDATVTVNVQNAPSGAKLDAWIDFNADGSWGGPGEQIAASVSMVTGNNTLQFDAPSWAQSGQTYARFRLSAAGGLGIGGSADDGEVEDFEVTVSSAVATSGEFGPEISISSSLRPAGLFVADIDDDGDADILASLWPTGLGWFENDGHQNFIEHVVSTSLASSRGVFVADFDGDFDADLLVASSDTREVIWYENDGSESFTSHAITSSAHGAMDVFVSDLDADGDLDILSTSIYDAKVAWYENDGSANFTTHIITTNAHGAWSVFAADVDSDGDMDVLSASRDDDKIAWYENDGNQSFTSHIISTNANIALGVFAVDVDNDGDIDVVAAAHGGDKVAWYENDGSENFTTHTIGNLVGNYCIFAADADGDGDIDVFSSSIYDDTFSLFENDGSQQFTHQTISTTTDDIVAIFVADLDGDGDLDAIGSSDGPHKITWYQHNATPTLGAVSDITISEDAPQQTVYLAGITAGGRELQPLKVTAVSSNTSLIPDPHIIYQSPDSTGTLTVIREANQTGTATITVTVEDGGWDGNLDTPEDNATFSQTFDVVVFPWQNYRNVLDVNDDGFVSPIDAFIVITDLNVKGARELPLPPVAPNTPPPYLDPSGDNSISPIDAFMIVSFLSGSGSGEGEHFGPVGHSSHLVKFEYPHQWNSERTHDLDTRPSYDVDRWRSDTDAPYTEQPIGFAERDDRGLQRTRMIAGTNSWRESAWENLLDEIAEDVSQLDNDDLGAI